MLLAARYRLDLESIKRVYPRNEDAERGESRLPTRFLCGKIVFRIDSLRSSAYKEFAIREQLFLTIYKESSKLDADFDLSAAGGSGGRGASGGVQVGRYPMPFAIIK